MRGVAPYPVPSSDSVAICPLPLVWRSQAESQWRHKVNPDDPIEWRPGEGVELLRTIVVDVEALAAELGVEALPPLRCTLMWNGRQVQGVAASAVIDTTNAMVGVDLSGVAPGNDIADAISVTTRVSADGPIVGFAPAGAILWEDSVLIPLSGAAPAVSIYSTPFLDRGLAQGAWCDVRLPSEIHDHPSAIEVLLDSNHSLDIEGLLAGEGPGADLAVELVLLAISDAIINWALERAEDVERFEQSLDDPETMGAVAANEITRVFQQRLPTEVLASRESESGWYTSCLQARSYGRRSLIELANQVRESAQ